MPPRYFHASRSEPPACRVIFEAVLIAWVATQYDVTTASPGCIPGSAVLPRTEPNCGYGHLV